MENYKFYFQQKLNTPFTSSSVNLQENYSQLDELYV